MLAELSGGITVRPILKTFAFVTASAISSLTISAPMSMLQSVPHEPIAQANISSQSTPSKMGWLTKWIGNKPSDVVNPTLDTPTAPELVNQIPQQFGPQQQSPKVAYLPPEVASHSKSNRISSKTIPREAILNQSLPTYSEAPVVATNPAQISNARALREQGHEADRQGTLGEAERLYRLAIEADPTSAAAVNDLALCLARQGELDSSATTFMQAISMRPEKPLYRNNIATVLVEMGLYQDAKSHLMAAYPPATASYNLGHLLSNRGKNEEAVAAFQEALAYDTNLAAAHQMLAKLMPSNAAPAAASSAPYVAQAPANVTEPAIENTEEMPTSATPSFPRLLPPVINR